MPSHTVRVMPWLNVRRPEFPKPDYQQRKSQHTHSCNDKVKSHSFFKRFCSSPFLFCLQPSLVLLCPSDPNLTDFWLRLGCFQIRQHWCRPWFAQVQALCIGCNYMCVRCLNVDSGWIFRRGWAYIASFKLLHVPHLTSCNTILPYEVILDKVRNMREWSVKLQWGWFFF